MFPTDISAGVTASPDGFRPSADDLHREANHRIANNLAVIAGLVRLHATNVANGLEDSFTRGDVRRLLDEIGSRIDTVGRLHRLLSNAEPGATVDLGEHLRETCEALVASLSNTDDVSLSCRSSGYSVIDPAHAAAVALIVGELVTNSIKHAHPAGAPGKILIRSGPGLADTVYVDIEDDGVGLPEGFDPWKDGGLGLRIVRNLAQQIGGRLVFDGDAIGLRVRLIVPVTALEPAAR